MIQWVEGRPTGWRIDRRARAWALVACAGDGADLGLARATASDLRDSAANPGAEGGAARLWRRRLLRTLAAAVLEQAPETLHFQRAADGAQTLAGLPPLYVSAAGAPPWAAVGVAREPLGLDLETLARASRDLEALWPDLEPEARLERWTLTEATAKVTGRRLDELVAAPESIADPAADLHLTFARCAGAGWRACAVLSAKPRPEDLDRVRTEGQTPPIPAFPAGIPDNPISLMPSDSPSRPNAPSRAPGRA